MTPTTMTNKQTVLPMRALLRDTALRVALLAQEAIPMDIAVLRNDCRQLIAAFEAALRHHQVDADMLHDAVHAQCALLDETIFRHLPDELKPAWEVAPLQVERFQHHDAGERIFEAIAKQLHAATPNLALLDCYSTILGLGFKGRYARAGEAERLAVMAALDARIASLRPQQQPGLIVATATSTGWNWLCRLSPWALVVGCTLATVLLYCFLNHALDAQLAPLMQPPSP